MIMPFWTVLHCLLALSIYTEWGLLRIPKVLGRLMSRPGSCCQVLFMSLNLISKLMIVNSNSLRYISVMVIDWLIIYFRRSCSKSLCKGFVLPLQHLLPLLLFNNLTWKIINSDRSIHFKILALILFTLLIIDHLLIFFIHHRSFKYSFFRAYLVLGASSHLTIFISYLWRTYIGILLLAFILLLMSVILFVYWIYFLFL